MYEIESFEVITFQDNGDMLLMTNSESDLELPDGVTLKAALAGDDVVVEHPTPFRIKSLPPEALKYLCDNKQIQLAEVEGDDISRLTVLEIG